MVHTDVSAVFKTLGNDAVFRKNRARKILVEVASLCKFAINKLASKYGSHNISEIIKFILRTRLPFGQCPNIGMGNYKPLLEKYPFVKCLFPETMNSQAVTDVHETEEIPCSFGLLNINGPEHPYMIDLVQRYRSAIIILTETHAVSKMPNIQGHDLIPPNSMLRITLIVRGEHLVV